MPRYMKILMPLSIGIAYFGILTWFTIELSTKIPDSMKLFTMPWPVMVIMNALFVIGFMMLNRKKRQ